MLKYLCDKCGGNSDGRINTEDGTSRIDLCSECACNLISRLLYIPSQYENSTKGRYEFINSLLSYKNENTLE